MIKKYSMPVKIAINSFKTISLWSQQRIRERRLLIRNKKGFGTLEVVIIIAVLLSVALIFRSALTEYAQNLIQTVLGDQEIIHELAQD